MIHSLLFLFLRTQQDYRRKAGRVHHHRTIAGLIIRYFSITAQSSEHAVHSFCTGRKKSIFFLKNIYCLIIFVFRKVLLSKVM